MVTTNDRRRMLDDAWDATDQTALTLREQLRANERAAGAVVAGGSLSSISKNNSSHSYAFGQGVMTSVEVANVWRELIDLFDVIKNGGTYTTDDDVYAEMMRRLVPIREFVTDHSCGGWQ